VIRLQVVYSLSERDIGKIFYVSEIELAKDSLRRELAHVPPTPPALPKPPRRVNA